jgi:putative transposase
LIPRDRELPKVAEHLEENRTDVLAFTAFPNQIWLQIWSNNAEEGLDAQMRRRVDPVASCPPATK